MVEDTRSSIVVEENDLEDESVDVLDEQADDAAKEQAEAAAREAEEAAKAAQAKAEERERVLAELGDYFLLTIPTGAPGIGFYQTRISMNQGVPTVDRATMIGILEKIVRDLKTIEEIEFQTQYVAMRQMQEQQRVEQAKRDRATAKLVDPTGKKLA